MSRAGNGSARMAIIDTARLPLPDVSGASKHRSKRSAHGAPGWACPSGRRSGQWACFLHRLITTAFMAASCWSGAWASSNTDQRPVSLSVSSPSDTVVHFGLLSNFPPFEIWPQDGQPGGMDFELLRELEARVHVKFVPVRYTDFTQLEDDLRAGRLELAGAMAVTGEHEAFLRYSQTYTIMDQALVVREQDTSAGLSPDMAGRRLAVVAGYASQSQARTLFPLARLVEVRTVEEGLQALTENRADAMIEAQPVLVYLMAHHDYPSLRIARRLAWSTGALHFAAPQDRADLIAALDEGLRLLGEDRRDQLLGRWSAQGQDAQPKLTLSEAQRRYLDSLPELTVGLLTDQAPFAYLDAQGQASGLSVELLESTLTKLGLKIKRWEMLNPDDALDAARTGRVDLLVGLDETAARRADLQFVGPYLERPMVLLGRRGSTLWSLPQAQGRRLAITRDHVALPLIESRYPGIDIVPCSNLDDCLTQVSEQKADITISDLITGATQLSGAAYPRLQIVGVASDLHRDQSFALPMHRAALAPMLKAALDVTANSDMPALKSKWLSPAGAQEQLYLRVTHWAWMGLVVLAALLITWWWTNHRQKEQVRRTLRAQQHAVRSEAATKRFVAFLAHEVRNSLHSVIAGTELLRSAQHATPAIAASLGDSARATLSLLNTLLDRDRLEAGRLTLNPEVTRLFPVVETVASEMRNAATAKGLLLEHRYRGSDADLVEVDVLRVQQIVRNLVSNAVKYTREGKVTIETTCAPTTNDAARAEITVRVLDTGPGIAPEDLDQLFTVYHTTATSQEEVSSTGLGLALSKELAQLMGGDLTVSTEVGRGSCFMLRWWTHLLTPSERDGARPMPSLTGGGRRVLIVEDAEVYALLLERAFADEGWDVRVSGTLMGTRALLQLESYDLLLTDLQLEDGNALQLLQMIKDLASPDMISMPKIVMSAELEDVDVAGLYDAGAHLVITKSSNVVLFVRQLVQHPGLRMQQGDVFRLSTMSLPTD